MASSSLALSALRHVLEEHGDNASADVVASARALRERLRYRAKRAARRHRRSGSGNCSADGDCSGTDRASSYAESLPDLELRREDDPDDDARSTDDIPGSPVSSPSVRSPSVSSPSVSVSSPFGGPSELSSLLELATLRAAGRTSPVEHIEPRGRCRSVGVQTDPLPSIMALAQPAPAPLPTAAMPSPLDDPDDDPADDAEEYLLWDHEMAGTWWSEA